MQKQALKQLTRAVIVGLGIVPLTSLAAINSSDPVISSSTHTENVSSTASDITTSWTSVTSNLGGSEDITYEYLFDTTASYTNSVFQTAYDANSGNASVPYTGALSNTTSRTFDDVPDGTYYLHIRAYDSEGPVQGSGVVSFGPFVLDSAPTLAGTPISPATGNHANAVSVTISGGKFIDGATVDIVGPNDVDGVTATTVALTSVVVSNANTITAQVPADIVPGTYDLTVTNAAPFSQAISSTDAFVSTNTAPTAAPGEDQVLDLSGASVNISLDGSSSSDSDGDTISTYTWSVLDKPSSSTLAASFTGSTLSQSVSVAGTYQFGLIVSDGYADSAQDTVSVTVQSTSVNNPPTAAAGDDQSGVVGEAVNLSASASTDTDTGDTLTYSWAFTSVPSGSSAAFDSATSETPAFSPDVAGTYQITLTVFDDATEAATDTDTIIVTVVAASTATTDVDGDGDADANDGLMIQRRLNSAGTVTSNITLPTSVGGSDAGGARTNAEIVAVIDAIGTDYDVDGDSDADASDGALIQRRLTGAGTVTTNISMPSGVGGGDTAGAYTNAEVVAAIDAMAP